MQKLYARANFSISTRKADRIYVDMLEAAACFYRSRGDKEKGSLSHLILGLIKKEAPRLLEEIKRKHGVDVLDVYRSLQEEKIDPTDFFAQHSRKRDIAGQMIREKFEETNDHV